MSNLKDKFKITSVTREDLEDIGFDTSNVEDSTMEKLARRLSDDYCTNLFWCSLEIIAESLNIPKYES